MNLVRCAAVAALVLVSGCSKLTVENYDRLKVGMTFAEVTQILGSPSKCDDTVGLRRCTWGHEQRRIAASFAADRLVLRTATGIE
jgi:SmpA / OmlA family